ncbi:MAG: glycosyltransferase family 2 protein [Actinobacteria bacterium]|nr:glycosyltransferase family 2 protein [Actinomycetota bacterium]
MTTASILIRTKNEARSLGATLKQVSSQTLPPFEIFIIDSGSHDKTLEIAARFPVQIIDIPQREWSYGRALNLGAAQAKGEIIVCLSAHCLPTDNHWLERLLRHFDDPSVAAAWGPSRRPDRPLPPPSPPTRQEPGDYTLETRTFGLENSNSALRRALWLEFPFDESLPAAEDKAWGMEAMRRGYSLIFDPSAAVWHEAHSAGNSFRRNRAVLAGFRTVFPELSKPALQMIANLGMRIVRKISFHARLRDPKRLLTDLSRAPSIVAGVLGKVLSWRR